MSHAFISYVRENSDEVDRLRLALEAAGVRCWIDREDLAVGDRWKDAIRKAIHSGSYFIACFSREFHSKDKSYMHEELTVAIDELRQRSTEASWFIPVLLNDSPVPGRSIGGGESLASFQFIRLYEDWDLGMSRLVKVLGQPSEGEDISDEEILKDAFPGIPLDQCWALLREVHHDLQWGEIGDDYLRFWHKLPPTTSEQRSQLIKLALKVYGL